MRGGMCRPILIHWYLKHALVRSRFGGYRGTCMYICTNKLLGQFYSSFVQAEVLVHISSPNSLWYRWLLPNTCQGILSQSPRNKAGSLSALSFKSSSCLRLSCCGSSIGHRLTNSCSLASHMRGVGNFSFFLFLQFTLTQHVLYSSHSIALSMINSTLTLPPKHGSFSFTSLAMPSILFSACMMYVLNSRDCIHE